MRHATVGLPASSFAPPPKPYPTATAETLQQLVPAPLKQPQPIRWTQVGLQGTLVILMPAYGCSTPHGVTLELGRQASPAPMNAACMKQMQQ